MTNQNLNNAAQAAINSIPATTWWHQDGYAVTNNASGQDLILRADAIAALSKLRAEGVQAGDEDAPPIAPDDETISADWISASDCDGIAYDGPSFERGYRVGEIAERDRAALASAPVDDERVVVQAAPSRQYHILKTDPEVFQAVLSGAKTFEVRLNDRGYAVGDVLGLRETKHTGAEMRAGAPLVYTGRECQRFVSHVLTGYGLADGWCCLSFKLPHADGESAPVADERALRKALQDCEARLALLVHSGRGKLLDAVAAENARAALASAPVAGEAQPAQITARRPSGVLSMDGASLHMQRDGSCQIIVAEDDFTLEDDRSEGPDGPEGSVHWVARLPASELTALRHFLNGHARPSDDDLWDQTLTERDDYHDMADKLANAIADHLLVAIGEHSSSNCPWMRALEAIENAAPQAIEAVRNAALEEAARQCEDIYGWSGAFSAGVMHQNVLDACASAIRALKRPQADKAAPVCSCPSGDGSLRPCPVHQPKEPQ